MVQTISKPLFHGPVIGVEMQRDPLEPASSELWAVYTRHEDGPDFRPAQFRKSGTRKAIRAAAGRLQKRYRVPLHIFEGDHASGPYVEVVCHQDT